MNRFTPEVIVLFDIIIVEFGEGVLTLVRITVVAFNGTTILTQSFCLKTPRNALVKGNEMQIAAINIM